ncbi:MAG: hypothetical protein KatS3mg014_2454 [Actinomycetota bacterium]|nr:MAG: hypothetical protein KatS3mg014_2454 [Actinomycetota bacterium]
MADGIKVNEGSGPEVDTIDRGGAIGHQQVTVRDRGMRSYFTTLTIQAAAYSSGDVIGGVFEVPNVVRYPGGTGLITNLIAILGENPGSSLDSFLFGDNPSASTLVDKTAPVIAAADRPKLVAQVGSLFSVSRGGTTFFNYVPDNWNLAVPFVCTGTSLWLVLFVNNAVTLTTTQMHVRLYWEAA